VKASGCPPLTPQSAKRHGYIPDSIDGSGLSPAQF
jgi:hypothetical protein